MKNTSSINIKEISDSLVQIKPGLWSTNKISENISYPALNHEIQKDFQQNSFWYTHRSNCIKRLIQRFPSSTILDIGGSNGQLTSELQQITNIILMEPGAEGVKNALGKGLSPVIHSSLQDAGLKNNVLPGVGLFDVLEHIEEDIEFLKKVQNSLILGGSLYISVPAYPFLYSEFDSSVGHFRRYNRRSLYKVLEEAGFEIEYFSYMFYILPLPMWFLRKVFFRDKTSSQQIKLHKPKRSLIGKFLKWILSIESIFISNGKSIPFGSSCLCVAKKKA